MRSDPQRLRLRACFAGDGATRRSAKEVGPRGIFNPQGNADRARERAPISLFIGHDSSRR